MTLKPSFVFLHKHFIYNKLINYVYTLNISIKQIRNMLMLCMIPTEDESKDILLTKQFTDSNNEKNHRR